MKFKTYEISLEIKPKRVFIAICFGIFAIAFINIFLPSNFIIFKILINTLLTYFISILSGLYLIYHSAKAGRMKSFKEL